MNESNTDPGSYGGQAVVEGVMIRGEHSMAIAVRRSDGSIASHTEPLSRLYRGPQRYVPLLRGLVALWGTLALGLRALTWSSAIATDDVDGQDKPRPPGFKKWVTLITTLIVALIAFFVGPVLLTIWLDNALPALWMVVFTEGSLRIMLLLAYLWTIGRASEVRRVFQYHAAEHMTIHALEHDSSLQVPAIRRFGRAHPRCGTSFLLTLAILSMFVFLMIGTPSVWGRILSRLIMIPLLVTFAYEVVRWAGQNTGQPLVRWLFSGNMALQNLTTREPDDEQIQVAIAALELALVEDRRLDGAAAI